MVDAVGTKWEWDRESLVSSDSDYFLAVARKYMHHASSLRIGFGGHNLTALPHTMSMSDPPGEKDQPRFVELLQRAAAKAVAESDPWAKYNIPSIPAERVIRHMYNPDNGTWSTDETIVKIEREPFTCGAMRHCYRMKKRAIPPKEATNHRFHKMGWSSALNYVAKAYQMDGVINTSDEAKRAVQNDIALQCEAQKWAKKFNESEPSSTILFIRAYAIEFPDREGKPWFATERFIAGKDRYGAGFVKHNTNAGFVDTDLHRITPQLFSAHSFYVSEGTRLVADIQGIGDLYTDPQVLSADYRFGDGDLGPRGMALFFKSFRHSSSSDAMGIPIFALSRNELKHQAKYDDDEDTVSDYSASGQLDRFQQLDENRRRRSMAWRSTPHLLASSQEETVKRSNISREAVSVSFQGSLGVFKPPSIMPNHTESDIEEINTCLERARSEIQFTPHDFHRHESGELRERHYKTEAGSDLRKSKFIRNISAPMMPTALTKENLGRVHYQLAVLHGMGRFPEDVPPSPANEVEDPPDHDAFSVLFHLSYAAALLNVPACVAMGRLHVGLTTAVSRLVSQLVPTDFAAGKDLFRRAMASPQLPSKPKAAAGCLLIQILRDERLSHLPVPDDVLRKALQDTIELLQASDAETSTAKDHQERTQQATVELRVGDQVEANYCLEGTFYKASVKEISEDGLLVTVCYDDDGSCETLQKDEVRLCIPPTATQTTLGGPLVDDEMFDGSDDDSDRDDACLFKCYELQADWAALLENCDVHKACALYTQAAAGAMADGKMKDATQWSLRASELEEVEPF